MSEQSLDPRWTVQKMCTDIGNYELTIEKEKVHSGCTQRRESWKWMVSYHGTVSSSGSVNSADEAQAKAVASVPLNS